MDRSTSSTSQLIHLAWPVLVAQLAMMANAVIDTAMAGRLSAIDLASVGIAASIMSTVLMTLISVLLALPPIIAHLYGAGQRADVGREFHQSVWISLVLVAVCLNLKTVVERCQPFDTPAMRVTQGER
jgi:MATE family multidrug resistance protein